MTATTNRLGLGCVTFGRETDENASFAIMDYAVERGIRFFDTAESYGSGASERIIGRWLRARGMREQIVVATKVIGRLTRSHIAHSLEMSLERLGLDTIGAYLFHFPDPATAIEESLEALTMAVQAKRILLPGCSNFGAAELLQALRCSEERGFARLKILQPIYNLVAREGEGELLPLAASNGMRVVTYSPLGAGFLTGKYTPDRTQFPAGSRFAVKPGHADIYFAPEKFQVVERLRAKSAATGIPMARLAMAWVLQNPLVNTVLVGSRSTTHIDNAIAALDQVLPACCKAEMDSWLPQGAL